MRSIHVNSPGYGADLPVSRTGHQISRIKSSFELFCALFRDLAQFKLKTSIFLICSTVSGAFLSHSHWGLGQFVGVGVRWNSGGLVKKESLQILDLQRLASLEKWLLWESWLQYIRIGCTEKKEFIQKRKSFFPRDFENITIKHNHHHIERIDPAAYIIDNMNCWAKGKLGWFEFPLVRS